MYGCDEKVNDDLVCGMRVVSISHLHEAWLKVSALKLDNLATLEVHHLCDRAIIASGLHGASFKVDYVLLSLSYMPRMP